MSPVLLPWRHLHRSLPWVTRFLAAGRRSRVETIASDLAPLVMQAGTAHQDLIREHGVDTDLVRPRGFLSVFETIKRFDATALERELCERHDVPFDILDSDEIKQLEPGL